MDDETRARIEKDCKNALQCLYIAVEESVAQDVDNKVSAYVHLLKNEHSRITELLNTMDEYIALLSKGLVESAAFLDVHGWKYSQSYIDKGVELRAKIQALKGKQQ